MEAGKTALERIFDKVIFTTGPSSESVNILRQMATLPNAAVSFRINTSHTDILKLSD
jgi:pyruvate kinase